jgi:hypothetical protein
MHYDMTLKTPAATEPLTLAQVKEFLKLSDYADTSAGLTIEESILIASRTPGTVNGSSVLVTGFAATIELNAGACYRKTERKSAGIAGQCNMG